MLSSAHCDIGAAGLVAVTGRLGAAFSHPLVAMRRVRAVQSRSLFKIEIAFPSVSTDLGKTADECRH